MKNCVYVMLSLCSCSSVLQHNVGKSHCYLFWQSLIKNVTLNIITVLYHFKIRLKYFTTYSSVLYFYNLLLNMYI